MAGVALGLAGPGLEFVASSKRALSAAPCSSSSSSSSSCSASLSSYNNARSHKPLALRSSFVARTTHSSFWDGGEKVLQKLLRRTHLLPSLCIRAQAPFPSNDDNQSSPELSSNKDVEIVKGEVKRVEIFSAEEPSKLRYGLITGLAAAGLVETAYLTWMKLYGGPVSCPLGGTGCEDVLNSEYGTLFGVPLSLVGMLAYGTVTLLAGRLATNPKERAIEEEGLVKWLLLASTTAMGVASSYFMYILNVKLDGASCTYCVGSALLSTSLLLCTLVGFSPKDLRNVAGVQLAAGASIALVLSVAFNDIDSAAIRSGEIDLPPISPEVTHISSSQEIALAKHLKAIGAKMYGAFWCSHCFEQKQMFGKEAMKYIDYVECYPEGYRSGVQIAKECDVVNIQGFPTWIFKGQQFSGEQDFAKLAELSGLDASEVPE